MDGEFCGWRGGEEDVWDGQKEMRLGGVGAGRGWVWKGVVIPAEKLDCSLFSCKVPKDFCFLFPPSFLSLFSLSGLK